MKYLIFALIALTSVACSTTRMQATWDIDYNNKEQYEKLVANDNECKDFAYKAKVAGSRYHEADIYKSCLQRRGYTYKMVEVPDQQ